MNEQFYQQQGYVPMQTPYQQQMMFYPPQPQKKVTFTNPLGPEKVKELLAKGNQAKAITITEQDLNRAICTHREGDKVYLVPTNDGKVRCQICGEEFNIVNDATKEEIELATQNLIDIWNSAKFSNVDMPQKACIEFYTALAYLKKTPDMYRMGMENLDQYYNNNPQANSYVPNAFDQLSMVFGAPSQSMMYQYGAPVPAQAPGMMGMPAPYPQQQPMMMNAPVYQQPYYNTAAQDMQAAAPGSGNPFSSVGVPAGAQGGQPQTVYAQNAYQPNVGQQQAPAQPQQSQTGVVVTKTVGE